MHAQRDGRLVLVWPPELEDYNRKRFSREDVSRAALIVSPLPGARYLITPGGRGQPIPLRAEGVSYPVHWYADGEYLGEQATPIDTLYWLPPGGKHRLSLLDSRERISYALVEVTDLGAAHEEAPPPLE
jgi:penicillin-binding protein 1C